MVQTMIPLKIEPLTADQVKALKAANSYVVLRHFAQEHFAGGITAVIKQKIHGQEVTVCVEMAVNSGITNYEEGRASDHPVSDDELDALKLRAEYTCNYPHEKTGQWQTIVRQLRTGDQIQLRWVRGNHNMTTRELGLAVDEVHLDILRDRHVVARYMVGYAVTQRNCARMVRSEWESNTYR